MSFTQKNNSDIIWSRSLLLAKSVEFLTRVYIEKKVNLSVKMEYFSINLVLVENALSRWQNKEIEPHGNTMIIYIFERRSPKLKKRQGHSILYLTCVPLLLTWVTLIQAWTSNYIHCTQRSVFSRISMSRMGWELIDSHGAGTVVCPFITGRGNLWDGQCVSSWRPLVWLGHLW